MWSDSVNPLLYNASLVNYHYNFFCNPTNNNIGFSCSGFNSKLNNVVKTILNTITNYKDSFDPIKFQIIKEKLKQNLGNIRLGSPWSLVSYNLKSKWIKSFKHYEELLNKIDIITLDDVKRHYLNMFKNINVKVVTVGNLLQSDIIDVQHYFDTAYDLKEYNHLVKVSPSYGLFKFKNSNTKDENEAIGIYYQVFNKDYDYLKVSKLYLLESILREPFFDQLRTKEQLGYLVASSSYSIYDSYGMIFMIQSPKQNSKYLASRIKDFISVFTKKLEEYTEFDTQKNSLIATLSVPDKRITQLSGRIIREINEESYQYDRKSKLIKEISKLELNDIIQFYQEYIIENKNYIEIHNQKND